MTVYTGVVAPLRLRGGGCGFRAVAGVIRLWPCSSGCGCVAAALLPSAAQLFAWLCGCGVAVRLWLRLWGFGGRR